MVLVCTWYDWDTDLNLSILLVSESPNVAVSSLHEEIAMVIIAIPAIISFLIIEAVYS